MDNARSKGDQRFLNRAEIEIEELSALEMDLRLGIPRTAELPHVLTARAKGLGNFRLLLWHILPPAAPQLLALAGVSVSIAFAAAIPIEALCDLPGIGQLAWKAALGRDVALLINLTMIVTLVTLVANSASDLLGQSFHRASA